MLFNGNFLIGKVHQSYSLGSSQENKGWFLFEKDPRLLCFLEFLPIGLFSEKKHKKNLCFFFDFTPPFLAFIILHPPLFFLLPSFFSFFFLILSLDIKRVKGINRKFVAPELAPALHPCKNTREKYTGDFWKSTCFWKHTAHWLHIGKFLKREFRNFVFKIFLGCVNHTLFFWSVFLAGKRFLKRAGGGNFLIRKV